MVGRSFYVHFSACIEKLSEPLAAILPARQVNDLSDGVLFLGFFEVVNKVLRSLFAGPSDDSVHGHAIFKADYRILIQVFILVCAAIRLCFE